MIVIIDIHDYNEWLIVCEHTINTTVYTASSFLVNGGIHSGMLMYMYMYYYSTIEHHSTFINYDNLQNSFLPWFTQYLIKLLLD